jgi:hypothetical protein
MKMKTRSAVSFVRQQLKVPGTSEHSGRGFVILNARVYYTYDELYAMVQKLLPKWKKRGFVLSYKEAPASEHIGRHFVVEFVPEVFGKYYRTWQVVECDQPYKEIGLVSM